MEHSRSENFRKIWAKVVAKAWSDKNFKEQLLKNPAKVVTEMGMKIREGIKLHVHETTHKDIHLVIPLKPEGELTEEDLRKASGGTVNLDFIA